MFVDYVTKRRYMIDMIDLAAARSIVKDLPFQVIHPEDLTRIRTQLKLTQDDLADFIGYGKNAVYRWENALNQIPATVGIAIVGLCFLRIAHEAEKQRRLHLQGIGTKRAKDFFASPLREGGPDHADDDDEQSEEVSEQSEEKGEEIPQETTA